MNSFSFAVFCEQGYICCKDFTLFSFVSILHLYGITEMDIFSGNQLIWYVIRMNCATLFTTKEIVLNYKWICLTLCSSMECQCMKSFPVTGPVWPRGWVEL